MEKLLFGALALSLLGFQYGCNRNDKTDVRTDEQNIQRAEEVDRSDVQEEQDTSGMRDIEYDEDIGDDEIHIDD